MALLDRFGRALRAISRPVVVARVSDLDPHNEAYWIEGDKKKHFEHDFNVLEGTYRSHGDLEESVAKASDVLHTNINQIVAQPGYEALTDILVDFAYTIFMRTHQYKWPENFYNPNREEAIEGLQHVSIPLGHFVDKFVMPQSAWLIHYEELAGKLDRARIPFLENDFAAGSDGVYLIDRQSTLSVDILIATVSPAPYKAKRHARAA